MKIGPLSIFDHFEGMELQGHERSPVLLNLENLRMLRDAITERLGKGTYGFLLKEGRNSEERPVLCVTLGDTTQQLSPSQASGLAYEILRRVSEGLAA